VLLYHSCTAIHPLGIVSTKSLLDTRTDLFEHQETMPIFVEIKSKPYEESNTGLGDIVKELYAAANDGDSPLTAQRKRQEEEIEEALDAQEVQSKNNSGSSESQETSEK
jgi:hypothetical protein